MFLNRLAETGGFRRLIVSPDLATPWCLEVPQACVGNIGGGRAEYGQLIPSHDFVPHNCNPESKACKHPYLWTASQKLGLVSTAISLQHCSSLSCCSLATMLGLGWVQSVLKVPHYIILTFDRTGNAWVFLDNPRVYLPPSY